MSLLISTIFVRFNWLALVIIYLVVIAGSFVRVTGSGMGCPDWPRCFDQWIPPISIEQVPLNYKEKYVAQRQKKVDKFSGMLSAIGMTEVANALKNDPNLTKEEDFNVRKTWTEYINRLLGFLAGNAVMIIFFWTSIFYRSNRPLWLLTFLNLIFMIFQGWFGSIVVASNLVPWTITIHLFFALLIIAIQLYIIRIVSPSQSKNLIVSKLVYYLIWLSFLITFYQMFLGTQVRESIDELTRLGISRVQWADYLGLSFFIHRSFSWLVLLLLTFIAIQNERKYKLKTLRWLYAILAVELLSGVVLAHLDMIALVQNAHLLFASILLGILFMLIFRIRKKNIALNT
ncbi:MAG: COX15/CtaA family protein [Bacteroidota bacterium]|nr:COX15/CtaA family protein [Bacteroidota bacterium]